MARPSSGSIVERRGTRGVTYALRFRAYGQRQYLTLGVSTRAEAETELANVLADVRRGKWQPPTVATDPSPSVEPRFHVLASEWVERRRREVDLRTVEYWKWALSGHLLAHFGEYTPSQITPALIESYKTRKLRERDRLLEELALWERTEPDKRGPRPDRPLGAESINKTLKVLAMLLDDAIDLGYIETNVARGKKRRLKTSKPRRTWLEIDELRALLDAAGDHRALLATMALAGLRVGEACSVRWRSVNLARGTVAIEDAKTDAGERQIDLTPLLLAELKLAKAEADAAGPDDLVFPTQAGTMRDRHNVRARVLSSAVAKANAARSKAGLPPLPAGITNHTLRRTFCALLYEAGASPAYAMGQMGHTSASLALEIYTKVLERKRDTGARMDALLTGADWAPMGTNGTEAEEQVAPSMSPSEAKVPFSR